MTIKEIFFNRDYFIKKFVIDELNDPDGELCAVFVDAKVPASNFNPNGEMKGLISPVLYLVQKKEFEDLKKDNELVGLPINIHVFGSKLSPRNFRRMNSVENILGVNLGFKTSVVYSEETIDWIVKKGDELTGSDKFMDEIIFFSLKYFTREKIIETLDFEFKSFWYQIEEILSNSNNYFYSWLYFGQDIQKLLKGMPKDNIKKEMFQKITRENWIIRFKSFCKSPNKCKFFQNLHLTTGEKLKKRNILNSFLIV